MLVCHVAERAGRSDRTVRHHAQIDKLHGFRLGKKIWGFWRAEVERYLEADDEL